MSTPLPLTEAPSWPHCAYGADPATDPVGCPGIHVPGHTACLAHLADTDRTTYLTGLAPGADIDHRGTSFTEDLLNQLLAALRDPTTQHPHFGDARFGGARFSDHADFGWAQFSRDAEFGEAQFSYGASFDWAQFSYSAAFGRAQFSGEAWFIGVQFSRDALFNEAQFSYGAQFERSQFTGVAQFDRSQFTGDAGFSEAQFSGEARFNGTQVSGDAVFIGAQFSTSARLGPLACAGMVMLASAVFGAPVTLEIAASAVSCVRTRWESTATVRVRRAEVELGYAVLVAPVAVAAYPAPFTTDNGDIVDESLLTGPDRVRVRSVQGVDAAHLVLTDTDLSDCLVSGAFHLDQIRMEGRTTLAPAPTGWHRKGIIPIRWTRRRTLAEEHHWRAQSAGQPPAPAGAPPESRRWRIGPHHPDPARTPNPDDVAALYRQLRKAFEDGKNEPGAADFYYGECEMRRHDHTGTPRTERHLLWAYWLLSGYGLRASRALAWLAAAMLTTILLLMAFGLPASSPKQEATGTVPAGGGTVTFTIDKQDPKNPVKDRFTTKRFDKALSVTLNSVVFRSSGQDLTTTGTYIEMTSRILEPALLALAVLAIRGRIKR
ncbi:pentapeptide repeat-containing protein [Streptomyces sp. NPDC127049]|uniref:pentapeptide repeat-containing protein n=1 Tax=Streptomyces sp. NPDC127049 TaxID=3347118 RepID=UPI00364DD167